MLIDHEFFSTEIRTKEHHCFGRWIQVSRQNTLQSFAIRDWNERFSLRHLLPYSMVRVWTWWYGWRSWWLRYTSLLILKTYCWLRFLIVLKILPVQSDIATEDKDESWCDRERLPFDLILIKRASRHVNDKTSDENWLRSCWSVWGKNRWTWMTRDHLSWQRTKRNRHGQ